MNPELQTSALDLVLLLVGGLALVGMLLGARYVLDLAPMTRARREQVSRVGPVVGAFAGLFYLLFAARMVLKEYPEFVPLVLTMIVIGFLAVSWFAVRDFVGGVVLKAGRVCKVGDHVRVGGVEGRIAQMGLRVLTIETGDGDEAIIPYAKVARESLLRTPVLDSVSVHVFELQLPEGLSVIEGRKRAKEAALRSHWSALARDPKVASVSERALEVTVFSLDADHGAHIERVVRRAVAVQTTTGSGTGSPQFKLP